MQERYLGDSHDFLKYAVLKALYAGLGGPVGLNWYLTRPEAVDHPTKKDGEKRHHLTQKIWRACDPDLVDAMEAFSDPTSRSLARFERSGVLPADTLYMSEPVPTTGRDRIAWHESALAKLAPCSSVFLDPDNGFEVKSMSARKAPKYAYFDEVKAYRERGQVVVAIQFAPRLAPTEIARRMLVRHRLAFPEDRPLPLLRGRSTPNIYLQLAAPPSKQKVVLSALNDLVTCLPGKLEWIDA